MEIAIIDAEGLYAVYFDGKIKYHNPYLDVGDVLKKIMEHASEFNIPPTIDNYEFFYLDEDEQFKIIEEAEGVFPDLLHEAIKLYGLVAGHTV